MSCVSRHGSINKQLCGARRRGGKPQWNFMWLRKRLHHITAVCACSGKEGRLDVCAEFETQSECYKTIKFPILIP